MEEESLIDSWNRSDSGAITENYMYFSTRTSPDVYQAEKNQQLHTIVAIILSVFSVCCLILTVYMIIFPPSSPSTPQTIIPVIRRTSDDQEVITSLIFTRHKVLMYRWGGWFVVELGMMVHRRNYYNMFISGLTHINISDVVQTSS